MGWFGDLLKEVPMTAVLRERLELEKERIDAKMAEMQKEIDQYKAISEEQNQELERLRALVPADNGVQLQQQTIDVLTWLFNASAEQRHEFALAQALQLKNEIVKHHIRTLREAGFIQQTSIASSMGPALWTILQPGSEYVIQNGLTD